MDCATPIKSYVIWCARRTVFKFLGCPTAAVHPYISGHCEPENFIWARGAPGPTGQSPLLVCYYFPQPSLVLMTSQRYIHNTHPRRFRIGDLHS